MHVIEIGSHIERQREIGRVSKREHVLVIVMEIESERVRQKSQGEPEITREIERMSE